jgi:hypothetical protein
MHGIVSGEVIAPIVLFLIDKNGYRYIPENSA